MMLSKNFTLLLFLSFLASCSSTPSRPQLYPNQTLKDRAPEVAQADIDQCLKEATEYAKTPEGEKLKRSNNAPTFGTSFGLGFGTGATGVGLGFGMGRDDRRLSGEEQVRRNFTNQCLMNKGYQIVGWED